MTENQGLPEVKEKVVAQVLQGHLVPEVLLVLWVSPVLKEMTVLPERTENEVALEDPALRVHLEKMVKLDLRVPQDLPGQVVTKETQDPLGHKDYKACLVQVVPQEKMESPVNQDQRVMPVHLELQEARVMLVPPGSVGLLDWQDPQDLEVELVPLVPKEERVLLVPLGHLVLLAVLVCKGCLEKEEVLEVLVQRVTRVNQVVQGLMVPQGRTVQGVLLVPLVPLVQLASLETRVKVVPRDFQV